MKEDLKESFDGMDVIRGIISGITLSGILWIALGILIHISPEGAVEPCHFTPFSDADLNCLSLKKPLKSSELLKRIRVMWQRDE